MAKIFVARDNDIDSLIKDVTASLAPQLQRGVEQLQRCLSALEGNGEAPALAELATTQVTLLKLLAELQTLRSLKTCISARPPSYVHGKAHVDEWLTNDQPYEFMAFGKAVGVLKDAQLLRLWGLRKKNQTRYKFMKPPAEFPVEYKVFRKIAFYCGVTLCLSETTFIADWNRLPTRLVSGLNDFLRTPSQKLEQ